MTVYLLGLYLSRQDFRLNGPRPLPASGTDMCAIGNNLD